MKQGGIFLIAFLFTLSILNAQNSNYCDEILASIERYQTGKSGNILCTKHICLTDSLKMKLIAVLKHEFTDSEINAYILKNMGSNKERENEIEAWKIVKTDTSRFLQVKDSIEEKRKEYWLKNAKNRYIDISVIYLIGVLDIKDAIPALQEALNKPMQYDTYTVETVLARLGDSVYYKKWFDYCKQPLRSDTSIFAQMDSKLSIASYLATQESFYELSKYLLIDTGYYYSGNFYNNVGFKALRKLKSFILNEDFQDYFRKKYRVEDYNFFPLVLISKEDIDKKDIEFALKWMEENKGKYIINRDVCA